MPKQTSAFHCPRWAELPDIPLYLDQLVMVVQAALEALGEEGEAAITKSMVNNYVKHKLLTPPQGKKYTRHHIARAMVISVLKRVYTMQEIHTLIERSVAEYGIEAGYDTFCTRLEKLWCAHTQGQALQFATDTGEFKNLLDVTLAAVVCRISVQRYLGAALEPEGKA